MNKKKQVKPKWFDGAVYQEGTTVRNPFSGEEYKLNGLELSIYDFIIGATTTLEMMYDQRLEPTDKSDEITRDLHKGLDWFKKYNIKAYMGLLD